MATGRGWLTTLRRSASRFVMGDYFVFKPLPLHVGVRKDVVALDQPVMSPKRIDLGRSCSSVAWFMSIESRLGKRGGETRSRGGITLRLRGSGYWS